MSVVWPIDSDAFMNMEAPQAHNEVASLSITFNNIDNS